MSKNKCDLLTCRACLRPISKERMRTAVLTLLVPGPDKDWTHGPFHRACADFLYINYKGPPDDEAW
jgi:hypothetical protein